MRIAEGHSSLTTRALQPTARQNGGGAAILFQGFNDAFRQQHTIMENGRELRVCAATSLCRGYRTWGKLADILPQRFPNGIPIYNYGAANGEEGYSILFKLIEHLGETAAQKYPIRGLDMMPKQIEEANQAEWYLDRHDLAYYGYGMQSPLDRFLEMPPGESSTWEIGSDYKPVPTGRYRVKPEYRHQVQFQVGDLRDDLKTPFPQPVVLTFANALYQVGGYPDGSWRQQKKLLKQLYRALPPGSLFVVDSSEEALLPGIARMGFKPLAKEDPLCYVFERPLETGWFSLSGWKQKLGLS